LFKPVSFANSTEYYNAVKERVTKTLFSEGLSSALSLFSEQLKMHPLMKPLAETSSWTAFQANLPHLNDHTLIAWLDCIGDELAFIQAGMTASAPPPPPASSSHSPGAGAAPKKASSEPPPRSPHVERWMKILSEFAATKDFLGAVDRLVADIARTPETARLRESEMVQTMLARASAIRGGTGTIRPDEFGMLSVAVTTLLPIALERPPSPPPGATSSSKTSGPGVSIKALYKQAVEESRKHLYSGDASGAIESFIGTIAKHPLLQSIQKTDMWNVFLNDRAEILRNPSALDTYYQHLGENLPPA
jgi:hypothetical protein